MLRSVKVIVGVLLLLTGMKAAGQSQVTALPLKYHPGFAGASADGRLVFYTGIENVNNDNIENKSNLFYSIQSSFDFFIKKISTGIGIQSGYIKNNILLSDQVNSLYLKYTDVLENQTLSIVSGIQNQLSVSPKISFRGRYTLAPGISIIHSNLWLSTYLSENYFHSFKSMVATRTEIISGIVFNTENLSLALSARIWDKLSGNRQSEYSNNTSLYFQGGYVYKRNVNSRFSFNPVLLVSAERRIPGYSVYALLNLNFKYKNIIFGVLPGVMAGYQSQGLILYASYAPVIIRSIQDNRFGKTIEAGIKIRFR